MTTHSPNITLLSFRFEKFIFVLIILVSTFFFSCKKKKELAGDKEPLRDRTAGYLLKRYDRNEFTYDWLGMKLSADFSNAGNEQSFRATVRMKRDSVIWISITPALGIEVIRLMITSDSLKMISKIPDNHYYYVGNLSQLSDKTGIDLEFEMLQNMLTGNAIGLDRDENKFRTEIDDHKHLLISKYKRKVRRIAGVDDRKLEDDTIIVNQNDPRYQRTMRRIDEKDELIISRYWLEPEHFRLVKSVFNDLIRLRVMEVRHDAFEEAGNQVYPTKTEISVNNGQNMLTMKIEILKIATDKTYEFPFEIPDDYPRRDTL